MHMQEVDMAALVSKWAGWQCVVTDLWVVGGLLTSPGPFLPAHRPAALPCSSTPCLHQADTLQASCPPPRSSTRPSPVTHSAGSPGDALVSLGARAAVAAHGAHIRNAADARAIAAAATGVARSPPARRGALMHSPAPTRHGALSVRARDSSPGRPPVGTFGATTRRPAADAMYLRARDVSMARRLAAGSDSDE
eukprot:362536-Chlamydomonas_euryale.AAC.10